MLKIGQRAFFRRMRDKNERWYNCRVSDQEGSKLIFSLPMEGGNYLRLAKDEELELGFAYRREFYCVLVRVEGLLKQPLPSFFITVPTQKEVYLKKRRDAARVDVMLIAEGRYLTMDNPAWQELAKPVVLNLSRSGMLLSAGQRLSAGDELELNFNIGDEKVGVSGNVLGRDPSPASERERHRVRVLFTRLDPLARKKLENFVAHAR